jgi:hypothetical protein
MEGSRAALAYLVSLRPFYYRWLGQRERRQFDRFLVIGCLVVAALLVATGSPGVAAWVAPVGIVSVVASRGLTRLAGRLRRPERSAA